MSKTHVTKILVENGAATGIEYADGSEPAASPASARSSSCAGAFNSPKLLMLSGIGPADELRQHGIDVVAEVNEVGRNLQNHPGVDVQWAADHEDSLTSELGPLGQVSLAANWALRRQGLGASNLFEAGAFLRTNDNVTSPNMQYEFLALTRKLANGKLVPIPGFQFWMDLSRPLSRGSGDAAVGRPGRSTVDRLQPPRRAPGPQGPVGGVRLIREIVGQPAWDRYRRDGAEPGPGVTSDADLESFVRRKLGTSYHGSGTCRMGADNEAVVDADGRVRAVSGLRVVDASIMPKIVTANLNAPVMMMAEKIVRPDPRQAGAGALARFTGPTTPAVRPAG